MTPGKEKLLNPKKAAELLAVTPQTIKKYIYTGKLKSVTTPGGHHRVRESDVLALLTPSQPSAEPGPPADSHLEIIGALVSIIEDLHDTFERGHGRRVASTARRLAENLGMSHEEQDEIWLAGLLHDVGKLMIAPRVLRKAGRLTEGELDQVRQHPLYGEQILGDVRQLQRLTDMVVQHHERHDGNGYPQGLEGGQISAGAKIIAIAEAYDSMTSEAAYRSALPPERALAEVVAGAGTVYDPQVVASFVPMVS